MKLFNFNEFIKEAVTSGQMAPNISFAPNIAFAPISQNPTPDPIETARLNMRSKPKFKKKKKNEK